MDRPGPLTEDHVAGSERRRRTLGLRVPESVWQSRTTTLAAVGVEVVVESEAAHAGSLGTPVPKSSCRLVQNIQLGHPHLILAVRNTRRRENRSCQTWRPADDHRPIGSPATRQ